MKEVTNVALWYYSLNGYNQMNMNTEKLPSVITYKRFFTPTTLDAWKDLDKLCSVPDAKSLAHFQDFSGNCWEELCKGELSISKVRSWICCVQPFKGKRYMFTEGFPVNCTYHFTYSQHNTTEQWWLYVCSWWRWRWRCPSFCMTRFTSQNYQLLKQSTDYYQSHFNAIDIFHHVGN